MFGRIFFVFIFYSIPFTVYGNGKQPVCLWISSYSQDYEWEKGIGEGIKNTLNNACHLENFFLDSKRNPDIEFIKQKSKQAKAFIDTLKPDVVIASDDNVSRYVAIPYLKDTEIPIVFCGVNWDATRYEYPWKNATGMVEVAPIRALLAEVEQLLGHIKYGGYLSSDVETEHTDYQWYKAIFAENNINIESVFVKTMEAWKKAYLEAQEKYDFLIIANNAGIKDWENEKAKNFVFQHTKLLTVTNYEWMMDYAMLAKTKIPQEQGEWAAKVAIEILNGTQPSKIPIVPNRLWEFYINPQLLQKTNLKITGDLKHNAIKVFPNYQP